MRSPLFKTLDANEATQYRLWARENWKIGDGISDVWHPVVRAEIAEMIAEEYIQPKEETTE